MGRKDREDAGRTVPREAGAQATVALETFLSSGKDQEPSEGRWGPNAVTPTEGCLGLRSHVPAVGVDLAIQP